MDFLPATVEAADDGEMDRRIAPGGGDNAGPVELIAGLTWSDGLEALDASAWASVAVGKCRKGAGSHDAPSRRMKAAWSA